MPRFARMPQSRQAMALQRRLTVVDLAVETLTWTRILGYDPVRRHRTIFRDRPARRFNQADIPRLRDGGVDAAAFGIWVWPVSRTLAALGVERSLEILRWMARRSPHSFLVAERGGDIREAHRSKRVAGIPLLRGAQGLGRGPRREVLGRLGFLRDRGLRILQLVHLLPNRAGRPRAGFWSDPHARLTGFGHDLVQECERQAVLVDLADISRPALLEACRTSRLPVVVSHAAAARVYPDRGNLDDDEIRAVAGTGGVIGLTLDPRRLCDVRVCPLDAVVDHAAHVAEVGGPSALALGSYVDGFLPGLPDGLRSVADLPMVTERLLQRGWAVEHIEAFLGGNALRVLDAVGV